MLDVKPQSNIAFESEDAVISQRFPIARSDVIVGALLVLVMFIGGYFRFVGQNWDDFTHLHPDERFLTGVVASLGSGRLAPSYPDPTLRAQQEQLCIERNGGTGVGGYFDTQCSTLNPHNTGHGLYVYGTLPTFLTKWSSNFAASTFDNVQLVGYNGAHLVGRTLSAIADMLVIIVIFFIGIRLHSKWVGLLAAALYAAAPFPIQQSHFWTVDAMSNLFVILSIYFALRVQDHGKWRDYALFGLFFAMALAGRVNTAPLVGLVILAAMLRMMPVLDHNFPMVEKQRLVQSNFIGLVLAGIITLIGFRLFQPYAFAGPNIWNVTLNPRWLDDIATARHLVSGFAESPPNWQWVGRTSYLFPFSNMVLWGMGIALGLTGWLAWVWAGWRLLRGREGAIRHLLPFAFVLVYFGWLGRQWVMTMRYYLPLYPLLALFAAWALVELVQRTNWRPARSLPRLGSRALLIGVVGFTLLWGAMFTNIYRHQLTRVQASHWIWENVSGDFSMRIEGASPDVPLINIAIPNGFGDSLETQVSHYLNDAPQIFGFTAPADGVVATVYAPHLGDPNDDPAPESIEISITRAGDPEELTRGTLTANFTRENHVIGDAYEIPLDTPLVLQAGEQYSFLVRVVSGGPVISSGEIVSHEGAWDDAVPTKVCTLPFGVTLADDPPPGLLSAQECNGRDAWGGLINGHEMSIAFEDVDIKRDKLLEALDDSEYLTISSNRFYDTISRNPARWPMTMRYYDALFDGELGFELVATFQETFELGPLRVSDQILPTRDGGELLNEFEAEEAFHVYDHPVVFIFRKTDAYDSEYVHDLFNSITLTRADASVVSFNDPTLVGPILTQSAVVDVAPTQLQLTEELRETQYNNGAWYERFNRDSIISRQPVVTIVAWWLTIMAFGWLAWPLLFVLFPALADRGYSFAKLIGLVLTAWMTWLVASARVPLWSRTGIILAAIILVTVGLMLVWRIREQFVAYMRTHWRRLLAIEVITLIAFVAFLFIRLSNPDLWHPSFGGEKPMDFAYFNAVLRSSVFPALDPWYAGGFINYYYFGFVIVGTPVLLLGLPPSIAYNLILPTWFALTGIAAFSVAYNAVSALRVRQRTTTDAIADDDSDEVDDDTPMRTRRLGNPWVAGIAALFLAVVVGNLDTVRVFANGVADAGFYQQPARVEVELIEDYVNEHGAAPEGDALLAIRDKAQAQAASWPGSMLRGFNRLLSGERLPIATNRWYWAPTRIIAENVGDNAITEIPFFTFLYGDLHAHLIDMPILLFITLFLLNEALVAGRDRRARVATILSFGLGALMVGLTRATNTWDWPTFLLLGIVGMTYIWWLSWKRITRYSLISLGIRVGGFVALHALLTAPYIANYSAVYGSASIWENTTTPLWAYLDLHGLFLFLTASLLAWETWRWFRTIYVRALRGTWPLLLAGLVGLAAIGLATVILTVTNYPVAIVAIPLLVWTGVLFLRPGQSRVMQFLLAMAGLAVGLTLGVEFIVLDGDIGRQNTVFKFYLQAWLLFSVVGGAAFAWLIQSSIRWSAPVRTAWVAMAALLVTLAGLYPVMATRARSIDRMAPETPFTLDGMTYMKYATHGENGQWFQLDDDYNMIRWLQDNIHGTPVIMEAQTVEYHWGSRVSIYTGMPSVVGWNFHQRQQRTFTPLPSLVQRRVANVNAFYTTEDTNVAADILKHYDVSYIIVSDLERAYYPEAGLAKFDQMVEDGLLGVVYEQGDAIVYQVNKDAL